MDWLLTRLDEESEGEDADNEDEDFRGGYFVDTSNFDRVMWILFEFCNERERERGAPTIGQWRYLALSLKN